jgi:death-on-curing protein
VRYLNLGEILDLHRRIVAQSGGAPGVFDVSALKSAVAQPRMTFDGVDLYPSIAEKASALCYSLISNHPFLDGNKRAGHAAMEVFLNLNGFELEADIDEQEQIILGVASGLLRRQAFTEWLSNHVRRQS